MYHSITIDEFEQLEKRNKLVIIDVREEDEFEAGHIKGAKNFPLSTLQETAGELNPEQHYYVICHSGGRSQMACEYLAASGFQVTNVMGGMSAWKGAVTDDL